MAERAPMESQSDLNQCSYPNSCLEAHIMNKSILHQGITHMKKYGRKALDKWTFIAQSQAVFRHKPPMANRTIRANARSTHPPFAQSLESNVVTSFSFHLCMTQHHLDLFQCVSHLLPSVFIRRNSSLHCYSETCSTLAMLCLLQGAADWILPRPQSLPRETLMK